MSMIWFYNHRRTDLPRRRSRARIPFNDLPHPSAWSLLSRPEDHLLARKWIVGAVLLACALNALRTLQSPLTFSDIPGRSTSFYALKCQSEWRRSGSWLVPHLHVVPDRRKDLSPTSPNNRGRNHSDFLTLGDDWLGNRGRLFSGPRRRRCLLRRLAIFSVFRNRVSFFADLVRCPAFIGARGALNLNIFDPDCLLHRRRDWRRFRQRTKAVASRAWDLFGTCTRSAALGYRRQSPDRRLRRRHPQHLSRCWSITGSLVSLFIPCSCYSRYVWGVRCTKSMDQALPFCMFIVVWGLFSHNVLEERYCFTGHFAYDHDDDDGAPQSNSTSCRGSGICLDWQLGTFVNAPQT